MRMSSHNKQYITDWLNDQFLSGQYQLKIPVESGEIEIITKRRCWGLVPYVGEPFIYVWYVATNSHGQVVAQGSSWGEKTPVRET